MRFVGHNQIPCAIGQRIIAAQVGIGRQHNAFACILGVGQLGDIQAQQLSRTNPVVTNLFIWHHNKDVVLALPRHALDDPQAGERLASSSSIGEQHAVAVRLLEACFCFEYIFLLPIQQHGQGGLDVVKVCVLQANAVGLFLLQVKAVFLAAALSSFRNFSCCDWFSRYSIVANSTASFTEFSSGSDDRSISFCVSTM